MSISEQQLQDESTLEQQPQGTSTTEEQPQGEAEADTLWSQFSSDDEPLPDYGTALRTFLTKDPSSIPKKPRYSSKPSYYIF